jgi:hypothetical protein
MPAIPGEEPRNVPGFDPPMGLRRRSIVVTQNPADSLTPAHRTIRSSHGRTLDQLVPDFLVISLMVVVLDELQHQTAQMPLAYRNDAIEAFRFARWGNNAPRARCSSALLPACAPRERQPSSVAPPSPRSTLDRGRISRSGRNEGHHHQLASPRNACTTRASSGCRVELSTWTRAPSGGHPDPPITSVCRL